MTPPITMPLPLEMPVEPRVRVVCTTDPDKPRNVSGVLKESQALRRLRVLERNLRHDTYELVPVEPSKERR